MVVLATDQPADSFPITGFEGEPNRFDEDAKGLTNVGETGDPAMKPGTSMMLTIDMAAGPLRDRVQPERALRRGDAPGLLGHARGRHPDHRQPVRHLAHPDVDHAVPVLRPGRQGELPDHQRRHRWTTRWSCSRTDQPADSFPITGFEGEPNRFDEDAKGLTNVGETGDPAMKPGTSMMLTIDMAAGPLRDRVQPERALRRGDAPGLLGHARGRHPDHRHASPTPRPPRCRSRCPSPTPRPAR